MPVSTGPCWSEIAPEFMPLGFVVMAFDNEFFVIYVNNTDLAFKVVLDDLSAAVVQNKIWIIKEFQHGVR